MRLKKIALWTAAAILAAQGFAWAGAKALLPITNQTVQAVGGTNAAGEVTPLKISPSGELEVSGSVTMGGGSPAVYTNLGTAANDNVKSSTGSVFSMSASNRNAASRWILIHDKASAPSLGEAPVYAFLVPTNSQIVIGTDFFSNNGVEFVSGIGVCFSSTEKTCTPASATDTAIYVNYQ